MRVFLDVLRGSDLRAGRPSNIAKAGCRKREGGSGLGGQVIGVNVAQPMGEHHEDFVVVEGPTTTAPCATTLRG